MKRFSYLDSRRGQMVLALFLAAQLYFARDTLVTTSLVGFTKAQLLAVALTGLLGAGFLMANRGRLSHILRDDRIWLMGIAAAVFLIPMLLKRDWQLMYISILYCVCLGIFLTYFTSSKELARYYVVMITVLAAFSVLATYILRRPVDSGSVAVPVLYNALDVKFYNFFLTFVSESYVKNRNFGIFREPGVYQFFLLLGLFLNNFYVQWNGKKGLYLVNGILAVTMVSTLATGGIAELAMLALFVFIEKKLYRNRGVWLGILLAVLAAGGLCVFLRFFREELYWELYWEVYGMTVSKFLPGEESGFDRLYSVYWNLSMFLKNPLVGMPLAQVLGGVENNTSSSMLLFAAMGIPAGCLGIAVWAALVWRKDRSVIGNLALLAIMAMSFNTQNLIADVFFWLFPVMALVERLPMRQRKENPPMDRELLRKVQLTQLEIAKEIRRVCQENDIRFFLDAGTFLGAVRHQGFIPWDDDMDVGMLREDYDKFCRIAPEKLGKDYCFQSWYEDPNYALPFGKVMKRGTVYLEGKKTNRLQENGFYVDIFPYDHVPAEKKARKKLSRKLNRVYRTKLMHCGYKPWMDNDKVVLYKRLGYLLYQVRALFWGGEALTLRFDTLAKSCPRSGLVCEQEGKKDPFCFDLELFQDLTQYTFEGELFPGVRDYDRFLRAMYGDYMTLPPEDKRENRHQIVEIDFGPEGNQQ